MKKYFVIGNPIEHSLSPKLHNYWIKKNNLDAVYDKKQLNENDIKGIIAEVNNDKIQGINITVPYKKSVIPFLDQLTKIASETQSVNTIYKKGNQVIGDNTDVGGFESSLNYFKINSLGARVLILGAGGVVPSIIIALKRLKAKSIHVSNRTRKRAEELKTDYPIMIEDWPVTDITNFDIVINATSIGLPNQRTSPDLEKMVIPRNFESNYNEAEGRPIDKWNYPIFYDLIYRQTWVDRYGSKTTFFLSGAKEKGKETINGKMMFLYQARLAFKIWHNLLPTFDDETMKLLDV